jgi:hypothetical protein
MVIPPFEDFLGEARDYSYDPNEAKKRLQDRIQTNIRRYRDAQNRGDNYAIKRYELLIRIDKIDEEKLKVKNELHRLKQKFKK